MNKVKTFEDACKKLGIEPILPDVSQLPESEQKAIIAHYKLIIIAKALNDGWVPDWDNTNEYKYQPWFDMNEQDKAGSGLSYDGFDGWRTRTGAGSRLCFKSREIAKYAAQQFESLYGEYFVIR